MYKKGAPNRGVPIKNPHDLFPPWPAEAGRAARAEVVVAAEAVGAGAPLRGIIMIIIKIIMIIL